MRSLKTAGELTRGRAFSEVQRLIWVMFRLTVLVVNVLMENKTKGQYATSDQHKEH